VQNSCVVSQLHIRRHERDSNDVIEAEQCPRDGTKSEEIDNIEAALDSLQMSLEGQNSQKTADITVYPELKDYHMFLKYVINNVDMK
jgi:hypothetical protein